MASRRPALFAAMTARLPYENISDLKGRSTAVVYLPWNTRTAIPRANSMVTLALFLVMMALDPEGSSTASAFLLRDARSAVPGTNLAAAVAFPSTVKIPDPKGKSFAAAVALRSPPKSLERA